MKHNISIRVNSNEYLVEADSNRTLLDVLREDLKFTGVKDGCKAGECGACSVILNGEIVNSCLVLAVEADGADILTIEGLANGDELHPIQKAFVEEGAIQCGFCTPGMIMTAKNLLDKTNNHPTSEEVREAIRGNYCRCTGYKKIEKAILTAANMLEDNQNGRS